MGFPRTLEKLLQTREWRGSQVTTTPDTIVLKHPSGAEMRLIGDVFERMAQEEAEREAVKAADEARRITCLCGKRVVKGSRLKHRMPDGTHHRVQMEAGVQ